ncbi:neuroligin-1-like [Aricia agestis]|uniref:neuroligin-1-like n=1 Tax=Aricia agestis TaxID=91739 RepID=UPI001C20AEE4|nr:neuroligin-1-like [Aricia agestis]
MERLRTAWCAALTLAVLAAAGPRYSSRIVHTHAGAIRGVIVEPPSRRLEPVEVFRGVPYGARPPRLGPPPPPAPWPGTRLADSFAPVCPQQPPDTRNRTAALQEMPLAAYRELLAAAPHLRNQSEDCLYLNIYVPGSGARGVEAPYAVVAWLGGAHEWGSGNTLDGAVLAARAHLLVVTLNHRLGLLGHLTPGGADAATQAGGAAALDVAAALRWLSDNVAAFGGDPARITLVGHAAGAALANVVLMLPLPKGLISRALLLSGSALGPASLAPDAALARERAAQALRCERDDASNADTHADGDDHWLVRCVRSRPLAAVLAVRAPRARFLAGWAPSVPRAADGAPQPAARALHASDAFLDCALAVVVATTESSDFFGEDDIRHGFEEEQRNRILRTYVRNVYRYHRNEIFAAIRNEYTDWEKPIQHPINIRDATLEALSDAAAAPALRVAQAHARRGAPTYFAHLAHATRDPDYPQRLGSLSADTLWYFLGLPLVGGARNYSRADAGAADAAVQLLAAFAKTADPADPAAPARPDRPAWPRYDLNTQQYVSIGSKVRVKSHYRGHKMALWLHLVPQLHRPGAAPRHHQLRAPHPDMFAGDVLPELATTAATAGDDDEAGDEAAGEAGEEGGAEECEPSPPARPALAAPPPTPREDSLTTLDAHYYSYTVALGVTVGAGCCLLALNLLVFAGIYLQRGRRRPPRAARGPSAPPAAHTAPASPRKSSLKVTLSLPAVWWVVFVQ